MAEFVVEFSDDGAFRHVLRNGVPIQSSGQLEQVFSIVTTYFRLANWNLNQMNKVQEASEKRAFGVQAFLMSLTGLEAFANTYFHLRARELEDPELERRITQSRSGLAQKFREFITLVGDPEMHEQEALLARIFGLSNLRNALVHPRWAPSSMTIDPRAPIIIEGLVENTQAQFEDRSFCHEALFWCLLVVARISQSRGSEDISGFMFHWTGNYGLTLPMILSHLQIQE